MKKQTKIKLLYLSMGLIFFGCSLLFPDEKTTTDPWDYTWTIDTLYYPSSLQTDMKRIWGSAWDDVYAVGHSDYQDGIMWHFNGKEWSPFPLTNSSGVRIAKNLSIWGITGFGRNDVWIVARHSVQKTFFHPIITRDTAFVAHYNGLEWEDLSSSIRGRSLFSVGGTNFENLWVGGLGGKIFRYDGSEWHENNTPVVISDTVHANVYQIAAHDQFPTYALLYNPRFNGDLRTNFIKRVSDEDWVVLDTLEGYGLGGLWYSPRGELFSAGGGKVWKLEHDEWETFGSLPSDSRPLSVYGSSEEHLFASGFSVQPFEGRLYYYDGKKWTSLLEFLDLKDVSLRAVWSDEESVFVIGNTPGYPSKTIVIRGR